MPRLLRTALLVVVVCMVATVGGARRAWAQAHGSPIHLLSIDSDDAEEQADAFTSALRSRLRAANQLGDSSSSLSMLTAALRCPKVPDTPCLDKIAGQIKADRFIWGTMRRTPGNQVTAEVHLYQRGKPESAPALQPFSENLKDGNDDTLRKIAQLVLDKLLGGSAGTLVVHAGTGGGTVSIDGQRRGTLSKGDGSFELPPGIHRVEIEVPGFAPVQEEVNIMAGREARFAPSLVREGGATESSGPSPARRILTYGALGAGVILGAVGIYEGVRFLGLRSDLDSLRQNNYDVDPGPNAEHKVKSPCDPIQGSGTPKLTQGCKTEKDGENARTLGFVLGGAGVVLVGAGMYLLLTEPSSTEAPAKGAADAPRVRLLPRLGVGNAGLDLVGRF